MGNSRRLTTWKATADDVYHRIDKLEDMLTEIRGLLYSVQDMVKDERRTLSDFKTPISSGRISKKNITWLSEKEAATILGTSRVNLRRKARCGMWDIVYSSVNNRAFRYSKEDIQRIILEHSNFMKSL